MQILLNENNEIIQYATIGGVERDGYETIEIDDSQVPELFLELFKPKLFIYSNGKITVNQSYWEESETMIIDNPPQDIDSLRIMVATLQKQSVQSNLKTVSLENKFKELEEKLNNEVGANE